MEFVHFSITVGWLGVGTAQLREREVFQDVGAPWFCAHAQDPLPGLASLVVGRSLPRMGFRYPPVWTGPEDSLLLSCGAPSNSVPIGPLGVRAEEGRGRWALSEGLERTWSRDRERGSGLGIQIPEPEGDVQLPVSTLT